MALTGNNTVLSETPKKKKNVGVLVCVILAVLSLAAITVLVLILIKNPLPSKEPNIEVSSISISDWRKTYTDSSGDYSSYEAIVSSDTKDPFIAAIGYADSGNLSDLVYMENGKGIIRDTYTSVDPNGRYRAIGYIAGSKLQENDISDIQFKAVDFDDYYYLDETDCTVIVSFEVKGKSTGIVVFDIENKLTKEVERNCIAAVADGKVTYTYYLYDMPYKSRDVDVTVHPKLFSKAVSLSKSGYTVTKDYSTSKDEGSSYTIYTGEIEYNVPKVKKGLMIFSEKLVSGGEPDNRNVVNYYLCSVLDNVCRIGTYDSSWEDDHKSLQEPKYEFKLYGYIVWKELSDPGANTASASS
ncbi:MAG: hypothetical protein J5584_10475 [Clostridia bacterium]|nr:hypothetical protein [Clostridia bacterium]